MKLSKSMIWITAVSTAVAVVNLIVYFVLIATETVEMRDMIGLYIIFYFISTWIPFLFALIFKMKFDTAFLICYEIYIFMGICLGTIWQLYDVITPLDKIVHLIGGGMLALFAYSVYENCRESNKLTLFWLFVLIFSVSMMLGGMWEICEYVVDELFDSNAQRYFGLYGHDALNDTMLDLICDFVGAIVGATIAVFVEKKHKEVDKNAELNYARKEND